MHGSETNCRFNLFSHYPVEILWESYWYNKLYTSYILYNFSYSFNYMHKVSGHKVKCACVSGYDRCIGFDSNFWVVILLTYKTDDFEIKPNKSCRQAGDILVQLKSVASAQTVPVGILLYHWFEMNVSKIWIGLD